MDFVDQAQAICEFYELQEKKVYGSTKIQLLNCPFGKLYIEQNIFVA